MRVGSTLGLSEASARRWPVIVVGAGPAGSTAARELARHRLDVLLLDRSTFPRTKVCGCCLNGSALATLAAVGLGDLPTRLGAVPLRRIALGTGGRRINLPLPGAVSLSRTAFDTSLVRKAVEAGVSFLSPATAVGSKVEDDGVSLLVRTADGEETTIQSRLVIAADGLNGRTASEEPLAPESGSRIGAGVVIPEPPSSYDAGTIFMAVGKGGYVGLVRLEDGSLDVAAAFDPAFIRDSGGLGTAAVEVLRQAGFPPVCDLASAPWRGTPALTRTPPSVAGHRRFSIGDAAGYVEPFTGEGIAWALASGVAVAPPAVRGALAWSDSLIREWQAEHDRVVRSRQRLCRATALVLRSPRLCALSVRLLSLVPNLSQPVLRRLNRPARLLPGLRP